MNFFCNQINLNIYELMCEWQNARVNKFAGCIYMTNQLKIKMFSLSLLIFIPFDLFV